MMTSADHSAWCNSCKSLVCVRLDKYSSIKAMESCLGDGDRYTDLQKIFCKNKKGGGVGNNEHMFKSK